MKVKILKTIDEKLLDEAINLYLCQQPLSTERIYLIMSSDTMKELEANVEYNDFVRCYVKDSKYGGVYKGNKIAINDSIPFGEVEIR